MAVVATLWLVLVEERMKRQDTIDSALVWGIVAMLLVLLVGGCWFATIAASLVLA